MHVAHRGRVVEGMEQDRRRQVVGQVADQADRRAGGQRAEVDVEHVGVDEGEFAVRARGGGERLQQVRSEEHTSELQSLMRISYAVFCLKKKKQIYKKDTV